MGPPAGSPLIVGRGTADYCGGFGGVIGAAASPGGIAPASSVGGVPGIMPGFAPSVPVAIGAAPGAIEPDGAIGIAPGEPALAN